MIESQSARGGARGSGRLLALFVGVPLLALSTWPVTVCAQAPTPTIYEEQGQLIRGSRKVESLTSALFGDQVSLYNGGVSFVQTDVTLPGNNTLAVSVGRRLSTGTKRQSAGAFGDWELEIPHIKGVFSHTYGWNVGPYYGAPEWSKRCSHFAPPADAATQTGQAVVAPWEFWFGNHLNVPGSGEQELLLREAANPYPSDGNSYPVVTKGGWAFRCINGPLASGDAGEGFIGVAPDGTQYRFDWMASRAYAPYIAPGSSNQRAGGKSGPLQRAKATPGENAAIGFQLLRKEFWLLPTLVTDRFGNTVTYTYSSTKPWRLQSIAASDGRTLTLGYDSTSDLVRTVSDGTRTWTYNYNGATGSSARLVSIVQPDSAQWQFGGDDLQVNPTYTPGGAPNSCGSLGAFASTVRTKTMVHPSGAAGSFTFTQMLRGRSHVYNDCADVSGSPVNTIPFTYLQYALTQKSLSGPGLPLSTWTYAWDAHNGSVSPCSGCPDTVTMRVTDPGGVVTQYTHGNRWQQTEGQLLKVEEGWSVQSALRVKETRYRQSPGGLYPTTAGTPISWRGDAAMGSKFLPVDRTQVTQQGVQFVWEATSFDDWAKPTVVTKASSLGYQRTETTTYVNNLTKWVMGLRGSVTVSGSGLSPPVVTEAITYDPTHAWPTARSVNGRPDQTFDFYGDGTLKWVRDGAGNQTTYQNYTRGLAKLITYADGASESVDVGNYGQILWHTNPAGTTTSYQYDAMGRLAVVTYPTGDPATYHPTYLTFAPSAAAKGLASGFWLQTITTGANRTENYFDALWRLRISRTYDIGSPGATARTVLTRYDIDGRKTFESYPQRDIASIDSTVAGHTWTYNGLGLVTLHQQDSEMGVLSTTTDYLHSFQKRVTNPRGHASTFSYQAFDQPSEDSIAGISAPVGVSVSIPRDPLGKANAITRSGGGASVTRNYVYDGYHRLCKTVEPETGATIQAYDAAGNIAWRASGQGYTSTGSCDQGSVGNGSKISFGYDTRNRLTTTGFGDGQPSITRNYKPDGLLQQIISSSFTWTYVYNNRRLLEQEQFSVPGQAPGAGWNFTHGIDGYGNVSSLSDPWGSMNYAPNALGEPTQVSGYASGVSYHPTGAVAGYALANGVVRSIGLNLRGLPAQWQDIGVLNDEYTYDANGNVSGIQDVLQGVNTRSMSYDGLDRLKVANGPWGTGVFDYDALDNLIYSQLGGRTLYHNINPATNRLDSLSGSQSVTVGYDGQGNVNVRGPQAFSFDNANRIRTAWGKANYDYDGHGRRSWVVFADGSTQLNAYSGTGAAGKLRFSGHSVKGNTRYVYLGDKLIAEENSLTGRSYSHTDALGSPVARTNNSGIVTERTRYEPYGATVAGSTNPTSIGFTGHVNDADTGLVYMQQRYYDALAGRFLSVDPVVTHASSGEHFNRYSYVDNNPFGFTDPTGMEPECNDACVRNRATSDRLSVGSGGVGGSGGGFWLAGGDGPMPRSINPAIHSAATLRGLEEGGALLPIGLGVGILAKPGLAAKGVNAAIIREIKALPDGAKLTAKQVSELSKNIDAVLSKTLPGKVASGRVQDVANLIRTDSRFRFLDQIPGARQRIEDALKKFGSSLQ